MAVLLSLETATDAGGVALVEHGKSGEPRLLGEASIDTGQRHAATLLRAVDRVLSDSGRKLDEVELIGVSVGPGSFTGLRIGLSTALGLCFGTPRRIVPVSTLGALSLQAGGAGLAVPMLDARRGQVYGGVYAPQGRALQEDCAAPPEEFLGRLDPDSSVVVLGSGAQRYSEVVERVLGARARVLSAEEGRPRAAGVARLAVSLAANGLALPPERVELRYLRPPEAKLPGSGLGSDSKA
ncbi:MAG: tRNA (adenosine(37)-N6)-threonylcarbamoyltransferase complex dimerization subunit type 1 TsaB [bacterium]|nr:tRNA (adenosine(37)-N6)-threonylcarbamoyltransferase complex dimerization subunit type 1 TsaB [bacterium]